MSEVSQALGEEGAQQMERVWGSNQLAPPQPTRNSSASPVAESTENANRRSSANQRQQAAPKANSRRSGGRKSIHIFLRRQKVVEVAQ